MEAEIHYLGIRHHGPGCTLNLEKALARIKPDLILLEMPADMGEVWQEVGEVKLKPPVALLFYDETNPQNASFYPFAVFSPEWQTMLFAEKNEVPLRGFDLPKQHALANLKDTQISQDIPVTPDEFSLHVTQNKEESKEEKAENEVIADPLGYIAKVAGYDDGERWWEVVMEKQGKDVKLFEAIFQLMTTLREELKIKESQETLLREAYMRKCIRTGVKEGFKNIVIVCGAWHTPALVQWKETEKTDLVLLSSLPKVKVRSCWLPWTYQRLSVASGYGAGIHSPAWYEMLYRQKRQTVVASWMTKAAQLLRKQQMDTSSAHAIEGVRLANMLAIMRGMHLPGIEEMTEAAVSIFGGGYKEKLSLIEAELVIGVKMGSVPENLKNIPFQVDLARLQKEYRLKPSLEMEDKVFDLRKSLDKNRSLLLHRLSLLNIEWGLLKYAGGNKRGDFHENWRLQWQPEMEIAVVEAGMWGNTVWDAAQQFALKKGNEASDLGSLAQLFEKCLLADIPQAIPTILQKLRSLAAITHDITQLMDALGPLIKVVKYNDADVKKRDVEAVGILIDELIPRIAISLPNLCTALDAAGAEEMWSRIQESTRDINTLNESVHTETWYQMLLQIPDAQQMDGLIVGGTCRLLFESGRLSLLEMGNQLSQALSIGSEPLFAARWLSGCLSGSGNLLIHHQVLLVLIDAWIDGLTEDAFTQIAPLIRRVFSRFSVPERQKIFSIITQVQTEEVTHSHTVNTHPFEGEMKTAFAGWLNKIIKT